MDQSKSIFETLFEINVNDHVEKKNGLSYLSWPYAWAEVKKRFPDANYKVYETESGCIYFTDGKTCWVKTGVEIAGLEHIEYLPIMDYKNKSISLENVTSFDVNKSIQRSLTKALARHGLGLYLYAGEDLPEIEIEKISAKDAKILQSVVKSFDEPDKLYATLLKKYNVQSFKELTVKQRVEILEGLNGLRARAASGRNSEFDKQEKAQSDANGSEQHDNAFDRKL
ncbi:MAG: DUF1071 domain-containing protein [Acutalibacteraceae bacterium]|jgi:hypothetical protein